MKYLLFLGLIACSVLTSVGQDGDFRLGARNSGLGGASVTLEDGWSLYNNVAGLGSLDHSAALIGYQNRFNLSALQVVGAGYTHHTSLVNAGVSFYRFGDDLFSQQKITLAVANTIDRISLGAAVSMLQNSVEGLGNSNAFVVEFGAIARITKQLKFGAHAYNINQAEVVDGETLPTVLRGGITYTPISSLSVTVEVQKDLDFEEIFKAGIEYEIIKNVWVRTGISTEPFKAAFGAGILWKSFLVDYSFNDQTDLGDIHEISLAYLFGKQDAQ